MSIKLKRVELSNIRTHKHVVFTPEDEGITAISGPNGSGKSTIVDSVVWAMFGTKPAGVSKTIAIYRNGATFGTDKCFAIVDIEVDKRELRIERRIVNKTGTVECDVYEAEIDDDGTKQYKHVSGPAVSHTEAYIRKFLKMDEKGFLAAILVQQKQVDHLISAPPKERGLIIEKLTGILAVSASLKKARENATELKNLAKAAEVNDDDFKKLEKEKETAEKDYENSKETHDKLVVEVSESKSTLDELKEKVDTESRKIDSVEDFKDKLNKIDARISAQQENLDVVLKDKDEKRTKLSKLGGTAHASELEPKLQNLKRSLQSLISEKSSVEKTIETNRSNLETAKSLIEKSSVKTIEEAEAGLQKYLKNIDALNRKSEKSRAVIMSADSEKAKLDKAISVLSHGQGTCPTCLQHVDDVSAAVETLESQKKEIDSKKEAAQEEISSTQEKIIQSEEVAEKFETLIEALKTDAEISETIKEEELEIERLSGLIKSAESELEAFEKVYYAALRQSETKAEYDALLERAKSISSEIDSLLAKKEEGEQRIKNSGAITSAALQKLRRKLDEVSEKWDKSNSKLSDARVALTSDTGNLKYLTEKVNDYKRELEKHREVLKNVEIAQHTMKVIEEFRADRIANSVPVLEVYASDLLNRFTEGMFTRLKLDSKFQATVVKADGTESPVGLLSGGELSAAAIALRIAISMLLNGGDNESLIILDEVLVSQDDNRAELILSTIKEVCKGQVVLVAHNSITDGISDKVVELGGS